MYMQIINKIQKSFCVAFLIIVIFFGSMQSCANPILY